MDDDDYDSDGQSMWVRRVPDLEEWCVVEFHDGVEVTRFQSSRRDDCEVWIEGYAAGAGDYGA